MKIFITVLAIMFFLLPAKSQAQWDVSGGGGQFSITGDSVINIKANPSFKGSWNATTLYEGKLPASINVSFENHKGISASAFDQKLQIFFTGDSTDSSATLWVKGTLKQFVATPNLELDKAGEWKLTLNFPEEHWGENVHEFGFYFYSAVSNAEYEIEFSNIEFKIPKPNDLKSAEVYSDGILWKWNYPYSLDNISFFLEARLDTSIVSLGTSLETEYLQKEHLLLSEHVFDRPWLKPGDTVTVRVSAVDLKGNISEPTNWVQVILPLDTTSVVEEQTPNNFQLHQNYPNPFNPSTNISFSLEKTTIVDLNVFNLLGQKVATLINHEAVGVGSHTITFDAADLTSGTYYYSLRTREGTKTQKMTFLK